MFNVFITIYFYLKLSYIEILKAEAELHFDLVGFVTEWNF